MICDLHTHSAFSPDAKDTAQAMILKAIDMGIQYYAVTDHCDCNFWELAPSPDVRDADMYGSRYYAKASISRLDDMKKIYGGQLELICGIELAQPLQNLEAAQKIVSDKRLDMVIGSHHMNKGKDDFYWLELGKMSREQVEKLLEDYFSEILDMCVWGEFDVLGHLTYPLRYIAERCEFEIDMSQYEEVIREIFKTLIRNDKGIEINTSGLRQPIGKTLPDIRYVRLFHDMGGSVITIGSDAHSCAEIGAGIEDGIKLAEEVGFEYLSYFRKRVPLMVTY